MRIVFTLLIFLSTGFLYAQQGGSTSFQVLQTISPARAAALGGNAIAVKDGDLNLGLIAPSLLDSTTSGQIALGYTRLFGEANIGHAAYAHHFRDFGTVAFAIQNLGYGEFDMTDETGAFMGNFNAGEYIFQVGYSRPLDEKFSIGSNLKFVYSELAEYKASAIAVDLSGSYFNREEGFTATVLMKNLGRPISTYRNGIDENLPFEIQAGVSKRLDKAPLRFSLIAENLQRWNLTPEPEEEISIDPLTGEEIDNTRGGFGENLARHLVFNTEILLSENLHIRFGYNYNRRQQLKIEERPGFSGITYGLGLRVAKFHLSYGRAAYNLAGVSNHFSIGIKFDDFRKA